jgi:hypothetical protein
VLTPLSPVEAMELLLSKVAKTKTNQDFLVSMSNGKARSGFKGFSSPVESHRDVNDEQ